MTARSGKGVNLETYPHGKDFDEVLGSRMPRVFGGWNGLT